MARLPLLLVLALAACGGAKSDPLPAAGTEPSISAVVVDKLQAAKRETAMTEGRMLRSAAQMYVVSSGACPKNVEAIAAEGMLSKVPLDPWGAGYVIACSDQGATLTITSHGPDGKAATTDDVVVATDE